MNQNADTMDVRAASDLVSVIDIGGAVTAASGQTLSDAYARARTPTTRAVVLNFSGLEYTKFGRHRDAAGTGQPAPPAAAI